jgi:hypothetical protein
MWKHAIARLRTRALEAAVAFLSTGIVAVLLLAESRLAQYVSSLDPTVIVRVIAALVAIAASLLVALIWSRLRLEFDKDIGIYKDRRKGHLYCPSCYSNGKKSPLKEQENGWACVAAGCKFFAKRPGYEEYMPEVVTVHTRYPF